MKGEERGCKRGAGRESERRRGAEEQTITTISVPFKRLSFTAV